MASNISRHILLRNFNNSLSTWVGAGVEKERKCYTKETLLEWAAHKKIGHLFTTQRVGTTHPITTQASAVDGQFGTLRLPSRWISGFAILHRMKQQ